MVNEKQLIDANDVYSLFDVNGFANLHITDIDVIPRMDVEPVRHGRWIEKQEKDTFAGYLYSYECSECGRVKQRKEPYCPNCGAKMDLEKV